MVGVRVASELVNSWRKKVDEAVLMRKQHVKDRNELGQKRKNIKNMFSTTKKWESKFHFFIRMRWVSIRWTPLLSIQSTCVISRRVAFSLFASLFACNFHEIKLTFFSFCLKKWKILGMIETKIQSKRKKYESQYCFYI